MARDRRLVLVRSLPVVNLVCCVAAGPILVANIAMRGTTLPARRDTGASPTSPTRIALIVDQALRGGDEWRLLSRRQHLAYSNLTQLVGQVFHIDLPRVERLMRSDSDTRKSLNGA